MLSGSHLPRRVSTPFFWYEHLFTFCHTSSAPSGEYRILMASLFVLLKIKTKFMQKHIIPRLSHKFVQPTHNYAFSIAQKDPETKTMIKLLYYESHLAMMLRLKSARFVSFLSTQFVCTAKTQLC